MSRARTMPELTEEELDNIEEVVEYLREHGFDDLADRFEAVGDRARELLDE